MAIPTDTRALFDAVVDGDPAARERAILEHVPLVRSIARRHLRPPETMDELVQVGTVALIGAVDRFDPEHGGSFIAYAVPTIAGEIQRHYRDRVGVIRLPRSVIDTRREVVASSETLRADRGHDPSPAEIAREAHVTVAEVREALDAPAIARPVPYWGEDGEDAPAWHIGDLDAGFAAAEARADLAEALTDLPARERVILRLRFEDDLTQSEIAERIGVSQMHVSRLLRKAIAQLREGMGAEEVREAVPAG